MGDSLVKSGVSQNGQSPTMYDTPQATVAAFDKGNVAPEMEANTYTPGLQYDESGGLNAPDVTKPNFLQSNKPQVASFQKPSLAEASATGKGLTKKGLLLNILMGAAGGAAAGAGTYGGEGFQRGAAFGNQRKLAFLGQQQRQFENQRQAQQDQNAQAEADRQAAQAPLDTQIKQQTIEANIKALAVKNQTPDEIQASRTATADGLKLTGDTRTAFIADGKLPTDFGKKEKPENIDQQLVDALVKNGMTPLAALEKVNKDKRTHISINNGAAGAFGNLQNNGGTGEDALKGAKPEVATLVRGIAKYEIDPASLSNRNNQRANVIALVKQFDPSYDQRNFGTSKNVMKEFTTGQAAKNLNAFNTATEHLKLLTKLADNLDNGDIAAFNAMANKYKESTGNPAPSNFETAKNAVVGEVAKTFAGQATVSEIHDINETINKAQSPAQLRGAIQTMTDLMASKKKALQEQYERGLKNKPAFENQPTVDSLPPPGATVRDYSHIGASK